MSEKQARYECITHDGQAISARGTESMVVIATWKSETETSGVIWLRAPAARAFANDILTMVNKSDTPAPEDDQTTEALKIAIGAVLQKTNDAAARILELEAQVEGLTARYERHDHYAHRLLEETIDEEVERRR